MNKTRNILLLALPVYLILYTGYLILPGASAQEAPQPSIEIISPVDGEVYGGKPVEFLFNVEDFTFVSYKNFTVLFPGNPNAGHAHLWIDPPPVGADETTVYEVESPDFHEFGALEPGRYEATVELVRNDHTSFTPRVYETVTFRVNEPTEAGRYSIIKTESTENVGEAPARKIGTIAAIVLIALVITGLFIRYRKKISNFVRTRIFRRKYRNES